MKALILSLFFVSTFANANCVTNTVNMDGRFVICVTCCYNGHCDTTCY